MKLRLIVLCALISCSGCSNLHFTGPPPEYLWAVPGYQNFNKSKPELSREILRQRAPTPQFDRAALKPGDVLLYAPTSLIGDIIAVKTGRLKSHVEAYVGNGMVFAAREEGVSLYPVRIDAALASVRRHPDWQQFNLTAAMDAIKPLIGTKYDTWGLFSFFNPWKPSKETIRVCSTVDCVFLRAGGLDPFNADLDSNGVTPAAFFETGGMMTIWRNPVIDRSFSP